MSGNAVTLEDANYAVNLTANNLSVSDFDLPIDTKKTKEIERETADDNISKNKNKEREKEKEEEKPKRGRGKTAAGIQILFFLLVPFTSYLSLFCIYHFNNLLYYYLYFSIPLSHFHSLTIYLLYYLFSFFISFYFISFVSFFFLFFSFFFIFILLSQREGERGREFGREEARS